ncbi:MAG: DUF2975 domain-containing protein [Oscillospiraceae bacterium]|nr:DUF2975 domain-containing protein [Oscillospiraceae bacterium]
MNWNKDKSVVLSQVCIAVFALCLLALDIGAYRLASWFVQLRLHDWRLGALLMVSIYSGSVLAWLCLYRLWKLLGNVRRGELFVPENVRCMRVVSWCCALAAGICALSALYYPPFLFVAVAAGFMALIVRIVKNAFEQAIAMKDELDLTV